MIGGGTARTPERQLALVSAVNGGLALSKSIAEQGILDGIRVNLVQPDFGQNLAPAETVREVAGAGRRANRRLY